ncbi:MAG TPA: hypothetical protein VFO10_09765 [Oligoflexus sp.]|uniref:hypothetical protein n=1 Tax=Oligoflexus sp. TaxID=1971216 RepID=UPI002D7F258B|nr:hypothetical protein [Oligoflexus sp.]HET9237526.1 hypothetical protein [Oligoflexus sp.]
MLNLFFARLTFITLLLGSGLTISCKPGQSLNNTKDPKKSEGDKTQDANEEKVDIPANIAGSYLTCALRKEAKADDLDAQYGCQLTDQLTKKKLDLAASGQRLVWSSNITEGVKVIDQAASSIYHVLYNVSAANLEALQAKVKNLDVIASWRLDSGETVAVKQDKVINVLKPAVELEDFEAPIVREQTIQTDRPGSL